MKLQDFMAWWPIDDDTMTLEEVKEQALEDLPTIATRHGHYWDQAFKVTWEIPTNGFQTPLGFVSPSIPALVARTLVEPNALKQVTV